MFALDLTGKRAWVTGGSRGIGRACVIALAEAGADVAIGYLHSEDEARTLKAHVEALGRRAVLAQGDVGDPEQCVRMHEGIERELGPIEILVNNAGIFRDNLFLVMSDQEWAEVLQTNVMGTVNATRAVLKGMWARRSGRIINMSSIAAEGGGRGQANYAASKGAIEAMTRNFAVEFAPRKITVNCVAPGVIDTDMWRSLDPSKAISRQLVKRMGTPREIAAWVIVLASEYGAFVTGQTLNVDGGWQKSWD